jgi:hypothetical protein
MRTGAVLAAVAGVAVMVFPLKRVQKLGVTPY